MKAIKRKKKKTAFWYPTTAEALDISDDIWARLNLLEIAAFHPDVMLHFRGTPLICEIMPPYYVAVLCGANSACRYSTNDTKNASHHTEGGFGPSLKEYFRICKCTQKNEGLTDLTRWNNGVRLFSQDATVRQFAGLRLWVVTMCWMSEDKATPLLLQGYDQKGSSYDRWRWGWKAAEGGAGRGHTLPPGGSSCSLQQRRSSVFFMYHCTDRNV